MLLGIDIGGTTINMGLVKGSEIVVKKTVPSFKQEWNKQQTLDYLCDEISGIITPEVEHIGIGVPTLVDPAKGIAYQAANIPSWDEVNIKEAVEKRFNIPVSVNNDSNCFALGAAAKLGAKEKVVVGITLGTGLGVGVIVDGKLLDGTHCGVGEIGALPYNGHDYEEFCSKKFFTARGWQGKAASEAAENGSPAVLAMFNEFGKHLGEFLTVVMYAYDADRIVFGGGVANSFKLFKESMEKTLAMRYPYVKALENLKIEALPQGDIPVFGASQLTN
jgi:glucokinase